MEEFAVDAIVLSQAPYRETDRLVDLFTYELGRLEARVVSGLKTVSKLAPHLNELNLVALRLVRRNVFTVADALTKERFSALRSDFRAISRALTAVGLIRSLLPTLLPEETLWHALKKSLEHASFDYGELLSILGYNPLLASCSLCSRADIAAFYIPEELFLCNRCVPKISEGRLLVPLTEPAKTNGQNKTNEA